MDSIINGRDSLVTAAPTFQLCDVNQHKKKFENVSSRIPKPFENMHHLTNLANQSSNSDGYSSSTTSPLNRAWIDSPNTFIEKIPESKILAGCVAFVDVWSRDGNDNRSLVFARILNRMGATVQKKFTKNENITHVIFQGGHKSYLQKAHRRQIQVVTCMWVEKCRIEQTWVDEKDFLFDDSNYKPPKRFREMQPLEPEEELARSLERARKKKLREERGARRGVTFMSPLAVVKDKPAGEESKKEPLALDTPYHTSEYNYFHPRLVSETPSDYIKKKLQRMREGKPIFSPPSSPISDSSQLSQQSKNDKPSPSTLGTKLNFDNDTFSDASESNCSPPKQLLHVTDNDFGDARNTNSTSHNSNMDLTCTNNSDTPIIVSRLNNESSSKANENTSKLSSDSSSSLRLHLSNSSESLIEDSEVALSQLRLDQSEKQPHSDTNSVTTQTCKTSATKTANSSKAQPMRIRRMLCDETLEPASILLSPQSDVNRCIQTRSPRRSNRRSSIHASRAIASLYGAPKSFNCLSNTNTSSLSALPPPGQSAVKSLVNRGRLFGTPVNYSSSDDENTTLGRSNCTRTEIPSSRRRSKGSFSTAYEDNNVDESVQKGAFSAVSCVTDNSDLSIPNNESDFKKRPRQTTTSTSDNATNNRKTKKPLKKKRKNKPPKQSSIQTKSADTSIIQEITQVQKPRRSTDEFKEAPVPKPDRSKRNKPRKRSNQSSVMVLTSLHTNERSNMEKIVKKLGRFRVHSNVKDVQTSHVVCGAARRTLNILHAIARGLWILSKDWVVDSERAGRWLNEEDYEVDYFPSARRARLQRCSAPSWTLQLFSPVKGHVYVAPDTKPPTEELKELVTVCGGHVIGSPRRALVRVGKLVTLQQSLPAVKETWVLDSIMENHLQPTEDYLLL